MVFLGEDIRLISEGYDWVKKNNDLLEELAASLIDSIERKELLHLYWLYSDSLGALGQWLQQLWAESLGKKAQLNGQSADDMSSLYLARGVSDQHSILQEIIEGKSKKLVGFITDKRSIQSGPKLSRSQGIMKHNLSSYGLGELLKIEAQATEKALQEQGIQTFNLHLNEVTLSSVSAFMSIYMLVVISVADYFKIDPFNQPGVESSKIKTKEILSRLNH